MPYKNPKIAKTKSKERWLSWKNRNPEKANARMREWRQRNPLYMMHAAAKRRCKVKGEEFTLLLEDMPEVPEICPVALIPIRFKEEATKGPSDHSPTLDKINPSGGYIKDNIRVLSHKGNRWKSDMTISDVERLLAYMRGEI